MRWLAFLLTAMTALASADITLSGHGTPYWESSGVAAAHQTLIWADQDARACEQDLPEFRIQTRQLISDFEAFIVPTDAYWLEQVGLPSESEGNVGTRCDAHDAVTSINRAIRLISMIYFPHGANEPVFEPQLLTSLRFMTSSEKDQRYFPISVAPGEWPSIGDVFGMEF